MWISEKNWWSPECFSAEFHLQIYRPDQWNSFRMPSHSQSSKLKKSLIILVSKQLIFYKEGQLQEGESQEVPAASLQGFPLALSPRRSYRTHTTIQEPHSAVCSFQRTFTKREDVASLWGQVVLAANLDIPPIQLQYRLQATHEVNDHILEGSRSKKYVNTVWCHRDVECHQETGNQTCGEWRLNRSWRS